MKTEKGKKYSFNHFKERLKERYNLDINEKEYKQLCLQVKIIGTPITIENQKNDIQKVYDIIFKKEIIRVVYSEARDMLTTTLPKGPSQIWKKGSITRPGFQQRQPGVNRKILR